MYLGPLAPVSNRASWSEVMEIYDDETDTPIDLTTATGISLSVRDPKTQAAMLTATIGSGIEIADDEDGVFVWTFTLAQMSALDPKTYDIGITVTFSDGTTQLLIGHVPVLEGHVR